MPAAAEAAAYLDGAIDGKIVGFGGSATLDALGCTTSWRPTTGHLALEAGGEAAAEGGHADQVYLTSANGLAESGRSSTSTAPATGWPPRCSAMRRCTLSSGRNKLAPTYEAAVCRARNVAAPQRAQQLGKKTPCAVKADRCYDCRSPERVCRALVTLWGPMLGMETEVLLVDEDLGL